MVQESYHRAAYLAGLAQLALILVGCATYAAMDQYSVGSWHFYNVQPVIHESLHEEVFEEASACVGESTWPFAPGSAHDINWFFVDSIVNSSTKQRPRAASVLDGNKIYVQQGHWYDSELIHHEIMHRLLPPGVPHGSDMFMKCDPLSQALYER